jgi:hypothetical protein
MAVVTLGGDNSGDSKTPTLRQFVEKNNGKYPLRSNVKIVFNPNQYGSYSFITDHNFRVQLADNSEAAKEFAFGLEEMQRDGSTIVVLPRVEGKRCYFALAIDTDSNSDWEARDWGYKLQLREKKNQTGSKTRQKGKVAESDPSNPDA